MLGDIQRVDLVLTIPAPPETDPRWSLELAGGATMDLGCYVLDAGRQFGRWINAAPEIASVDATLRAPEVDASMRLELIYPRRGDRPLRLRHGRPGTDHDLVGDRH